MGVRMALLDMAIITFVVWPPNPCPYTHSPRTIHYCAPEGDQPTVIKKMMERVNVGLRYQTLMGATGFGKTLLIPNVIAQISRFVLVLAHNKTLATKLCIKRHEILYMPACNKAGIQSFRCKTYLQEKDEPNSN